jgi:hypothetical protein
MDEALASLHGCNTELEAVEPSCPPIDVWQPRPTERLSLHPDATSGTHDAVQESMP